MLYHWFSVHSFLTIAHLAGLVAPLASPWDDMRVKHAWKVVPDNWESLGPPHPATTIDLFVALQPQNETALIDALYEVSTPGNPKYGAHLSKEEAAELVAPHPDTIELVHSWLAHHGVQSSSISTTHGGNWLTLTGVPVSRANKLLGASYQLYRYAGTSDTAIIRTVGYALPTVLHTHVKTVAPTTFFSSTRVPQQTSQTLSVREVEALAKAAPRVPLTALSRREIPEMVTPDFLRWLYKTFAYFPRAPTRNAIGIVGYRYEFPREGALRMFMYLFRREAQNTNFRIEPVDHDDIEPGPSLEANLEMQYAQALTYPTRHIYYGTGRDRFMWSSETHLPALGDIFLTWMGFLLGSEAVPQTIITTYGVYERYVPPEYAWYVCTLFAMLGARGATVLSPTGDDGVGAGGCINYYGNVQFLAMFPASCPWVTSVGGTTSAIPEVAANLSGGGFSDYFARPNYQDIAILPYLHFLGNRYQGLYNPDGRGIPDLSAQALNFVFVLQPNLPFYSSSTNCAATTVTGIISLLNDFLISNERTPLGFLNPWLYRNGPGNLNDIKSGFNPGCGTDGYEATAGWDPVTGLGTPDFRNLIQQVILDPPIPPVVVGPSNQGREFPELLNTSDAAVPARGVEETPKK